MPEDFWSDITRKADDALDHQLTGDVADTDADHRAIMHTIKTAVVCSLNPDSRWHKSTRAVAAAVARVGALRELQRTDGLFDSIVNLDSPPDSSFTINDAAVVATLPGFSEDACFDALRTPLLEILQAAAPALARGGLHTPNHRWEVTAALCRLQAALPALDLRKRIDDWLAEGVDIDADGIYSERSPNYAARVSNPCLLAIGDLLGRADLDALVHRNLHAQIDLTDPDGVVETVLSRRQDQNADFSIGPFLMQFRRFGVAGCVVCARAARQATVLPGVDAVGAVADVLANPRLRADLPSTQPAEPVNRRHFASVGLLRTRQGETITTVYGGSDVPAIGRIGSGLACNPTFLRWRWGAVSLHSVRLSRGFFGLGPFRSEGLEPSPDGARLWEHVAAGYYHPLPAGRRRADGRYLLEHEGRFTSALSFSERDRDLVELDTQIIVTPGEDSVDLTATFSGAATWYAFELCFRPGGEFAGVVELGQGSHLLESGQGSYCVGGDSIVFGPGGGVEHSQQARYDPGEAYTFLSGSDALTWPRVYLTGRTPGTTTITLSGRRVGDRRAHGQDHEQEQGSSPDAVGD